MSVSINGSAGLTFNDGSTQTTSPFTGGFGFRNRIINGAMVIDQRNAGASVTINSTGNTYSLDRWNSSGQLADGVYTVQRSTTAPTGFTNSLVVSVTTADASIGSTQSYLFTQFIEGLNTYDLAWGTASASAVTLSFWVRSSVTGTFGGAIQNSDLNRSYPFSFTITAANTYEYKTITIAGDTSGTWLTDSGRGMVVRFSLGVGSSLKSTSGAWAGANYFAPTGSVDLIATSGATFYVTGVQFEKGSTATSFDYRPYGTELALCQRYCYVLAPATTNVRAAISGNFGGTNCYPTMYVPVPFRSTPITLTVSSASHFKTEQLNGGTQTTNNIVLNATSVDIITLEANVGSSLSNPANLLTDNVAAKLTLSAEL